MTAIILAGGKSSRMGFDKAFIKIKGIPIIKEQVRLLKTFFKKVIIVTNNPHKYKLRAVKVIRDIIPDKGPLGGVYSGLKASNSFYNFVVACDIPFINLKLIKYMISRRYGFDVVVPKTQKGYEALFAIYSKNCIQPIYTILNTDDLRIKGVFAKVRLKEITEQQLKNFGDPNTLFMNINTKDDLCRISTYLRE